MPLTPARWLSAFSRLRRLERTLDRLATAAERQATSLERLADHYAPRAPVVAPADLADTGPRVSSDADYGRILAFTERYVRDTGREPSAEEVVEFLDQKERARGVEEEPPYRVS